MTLFFTADDALEGQSIRLLTDVLGSSVRSRVQTVGVGSASWDHIVTAKADLPAAVGGWIDLTSGSWFFSASVALGTDKLRVPVGNAVRLFGNTWRQQVTGTGAVVLQVEGTAQLDGMYLSCSGGEALVVAHAGAFVHACECYFVSTAAPAVEVINVIDYVQSGCHLESTANHALQIAGGTAGQVVTDRCVLLGATTGVQHSSGTGTSFRLCNSFVIAPTAINWLAGSIYASGLLVVNNELNSAVRYNGHTPASARVNYKANTSLAIPGLVTETAIVP